MIKRFALLCCILLIPTIAIAEGTTNYGDPWVGGQIGGVFTTNQNVSVPPILSSSRALPFAGNHTLSTDPAFSAGAIIGYNFCMPYRQIWERYFGVALDFQWNQFNQHLNPSSSGNQFALGFLGRAQYPLWGDDQFTRGKLVPFLMAGPAIVWTNSGFENFGSSKTFTKVGILAEIGLEYFFIPQLSVGPSFRYRHVFGNNDFQHIKVDSQLNQFMILGRLAYHF